MHVSVIIPCYKVTLYVERAINSVFQQEHSDLEVITVDDGSGDGTLDLLRSLQARCGERMTVLEQSNQGACAARNAGLAIAKGSYIQFLDADDVLLPKKISGQLAIAARDGLPELVVGSSRIRDPEGREVRTEVQQLKERDPWMDLMAHGFNVTSSNLWKRSAVENAGAWSVGLGSSQEYDLMFRMLQQGARISHDPEVRTEIHMRSSGSISQSTLDKNWKRFVELRVRILEHLRKTRTEQELQPYLQVVFDSIRTLYLHSPEQAIALYKSHIPKNFVPKRSPATGSSYLLLHRSFGFAMANRIRSLIRKA